MCLKVTNNFVIIGMAAVCKELRGSVSRDVSKQNGIEYNGAYILCTRSHEDVAKAAILIHNTSGHNEDTFKSVRFGHGQEPSTSVRLLMFLRIV